MVEKLIKWNSDPMSLIGEEQAPMPMGGEASIGGAGQVSASGLPDNVNNIPMNF